MKLKTKSTLLALITLVMVSCTPLQNPVQTMQSPQKSNLTVGIVKSKIIENKTTQEEVMSLLGAPNLVTRNSKGNEVWNYSRMAFESGAYRDAQSVSGVGAGVTAGGGFLGGLLGASRANSSVVSSSTTSSFDLIINFDKKDVVESYKVIQASY